MKSAETLRNKRVIITGLISRKLDPEELLTAISARLEAEGNTIVGTLLQRRGLSRAKKAGGAKNLAGPLHAKTYLGTGKIEELAREVEQKKPALVLIINELKKSQMAAIEARIGCRLQYLELAPMKTPPANDR